MDIDIEGLVADGHLKLDNICNYWDWTSVECLGVYTRNSAFDYNQLSRQVEVWLQRAEVYGLEVYRWIVVFPTDGILPNENSVTLAGCTPHISREEVVDYGKLYAKASDSPITNPYNDDDQGE